MKYKVFWYKLLWNFISDSLCCSVHLVEHHPAKVLGIHLIVVALLHYLHCFCYNLLIVVILD